MLHRKDAQWFNQKQLKVITKDKAEINKNLLFWLRYLQNHEIVALSLILPNLIFKTQLNPGEKLAPTM